MFPPHIETQLTKQSYKSAKSIEGVQLLELKEITDDGGSFLELGRLVGGKFQGIEGLEVRQINYSIVLPGAIKASHIHRHQDDVWFVPSHDRLLVGLKDIRQGSPTEGRIMRFVLGAGRARMVYIPKGVAHGIANPFGRPMSLIYFVSEQFNPNPEHCDELRLPPDYFGEQFWEIQKG